MRWVPLLAFIAVGVIGAVYLDNSAAEEVRPEITIDRAAREVRFPAVVQKGAFSRSLFQPGHHLVVSKYGVSRFGALFNAQVSDLDVRAALDSLGAEAGENLLVETWTERNDEGSTAPDLRAEGARIEVVIRHDGEEYRFGELVTLSADGASHLPDFRYVGNDAYRDTFESGCIVCNYSCPGGAVANRNATIREEESGSLELGLIDDFPIPDGAIVEVVLSLGDRTR